MISFRFTLSLFFLRGGGSFQIFRTTRGPGKKFLMKRGGHYILQVLSIKSHQLPLPHKKMNGPLTFSVVRKIVRFPHCVISFVSLFYISGQVIVVRVRWWTSGRGFNYLNELLNCHFSFLPRFLVSSRLKQDISHVFPDMDQCRFLSCLQSF